MKHRILQLLAASILLIGSSVGTAFLASPAEAASCPQSGRSFPTYGHFTYEGVNIRSGPLTICAAVGSGYSSHSLRYHCFTDGTPVGTETTWTYLTDLTTGVTGWASDYYLSGRGSWSRC